MAKVNFKVICVGGKGALVLDPVCDKKSALARVVGKRLDWARTLWRIVSCPRSAIVQQLVGRLCDIWRYCAGLRVARSWIPIHLVCEGLKLSDEPLLCSRLARSGRNISVLEMRKILNETVLRSGYGSGKANY